MENYVFYFMTCVPLALPSFAIVYQVLKKDLLRSVFNQQITMMILQNGLYVVLTTSLSLYILSEPSERSLPCQILLNLRTSYLATLMACGAVAVMFRVLMIRYAERGLVSNGPNLDLYNKLFWTSTSVFLLLYHAGITIINLREKNFTDKTVSGSLCSDPSKSFRLSKWWTEGSKHIVLRVSFVGLNMLYSSILTLSALRSKKIRKVNSDLVKPQIGKFRRHILTLKETITPMLVLTFMELSRVIIVQYALTNQQQGEQLRKTLNVMTIVLNVTVNDLVLGVFFPCQVLSNISREIPQPSPASSAPSRAPFYSRPVEIVPRRDFQETGKEERREECVRRSRMRRCPSLPRIEIDLPVG